MRPERFVTLCFLYSGCILLLQYGVVFRLQLDLEALSHLGMGLAILAAGLLRVLNPDEESGNPAEYGWVTHGMAALSLFLTAIFLGQLFVL